MSECALTAVDRPCGVIIYLINEQPVRSLILCWEKFIAWRWYEGLYLEEIKELKFA